MQPYFINSLLNFFIIGFSILRKTIMPTKQIAANNRQLKNASKRVLSIPSKARTL
jgi:hypothetical protein